MTLQRARITLLILVLSPVPSFAEPRFLSLPFNNPAVKIQQGPVYTPSNERHQTGGFAFDFILGDTDNSATWASFDVVAAADGVASRSFEAGYGNVVLIRHNVTDDQSRAVFTLYAHLQNGSIPSQIPERSRSDTNFSQWKEVTAGQRIGISGKTGNVVCVTANCIHLHFEVSRGGYHQGQVDAYDISDSNTMATVPPSFTRGRYPFFTGFSGCGPMMFWISCPPDVSPSPAPPLPVSPQFDFAVSSLTVAGNIPGSFSDNFNDGSLTVFPTSAVTCLQDSVKSESGGFLRLISTDGVNTLSPGFLVDHCILGLDDAKAIWRIRDSYGNATITASFRADTPLPNQAYGLQLIAFSPGPQQEIVNIQVEASGSGSVVYAVAEPAGGGSPIGLVPVNLIGISHIMLRLVFNDISNTVNYSFSINSGATFSAIPVSQPGRVLSGWPEGVVSVFGAVAAP